MLVIAWLAWSCARGHCLVSRERTGTPGLLTWGKRKFKIQSLVSRKCTLLSLCYEVKNPKSKHPQLETVHISSFSVKRFLRSPSCSFPLCFPFLGML